MHHITQQALTNAGLGPFKTNDEYAFYLAGLAQAAGLAAEALRVYPPIFEKTLKQLAAAFEEKAPSLSQQLTELADTIANSHSESSEEFTKMREAALTKSKEIVWGKK